MCLEDHILCMGSRIPDVEAFREEHSAVHIENMGERSILTVEADGTLHVGDESRPTTIHIDDPDVTVL